MHYITVCVLGQYSAGHCLSKSVCVLNMRAAEMHTGTAAVLKFMAHSHLLSLCPTVGVCSEGTLLHSVFIVPWLSL